MYATKQPYQIYTDKNGKPLLNGLLYFGQANLNPETNPQPVFWDANATIIAPNPVPCLNGFPVYNGAPANVFVNDFYSLTVRDAAGVFQYTFPDSSAYDTPTTVAGSNVFSGKNLLLNSRFLINQRQYVNGTNVAGAGIFTRDGWAVMTSGQSATYTADGVDAIAIAPAGGLQQGVEPSFVQGGVYTISWDGTAGCTVNGTNVTNGQNITLATGVAVYVRFIGGTVARPQLELSPQKTQFDRRLPTDELLACQRYCYVVSDIYNLGGAAATTTSCMTRYRFPTEMYATPTTTILRTGAYYISDDYSSDPISATPSIGGTAIDRRTGGRVLIGGFTGLTAGRYYNTSANLGGCLIMFESVV